MATPVFKFPVQANDSGETTYLTRTAVFGDGYAQVSGDGINSYKASWAITYSGKIEKVMEVRAFLDQQAGYKSFLWTDPTGRIGLYRSAKYEVLPYARDVFRLTATFEQAYGP